MAGKATIIIQGTAWGVRENAERQTVSERIDVARLP
nr:MAG TPA_asm: hypothetical protein [Caudoviricetes sp.]